MHVHENVNFLITRLIGIRSRKGWGETHVRRLLLLAFYFYLYTFRLVLMCTISKDPNIHDPASREAKSRARKGRSDVICRKM